MKTNCLTAQKFNRLILSAVLVAFFAAFLISSSAFSALAQSFSKTVAGQNSTILENRDFADFIFGSQNHLVSPTDKIFRSQALVSSSVVISQLYGGGGNTGATYRNDYVEIFNLSSTPQSLNGLSLQYGSSSGNFGSSSGNVFALPNVTLQPGQYFLFAGNSAGAIGATTPAPDASSNTFSMSGTAGKVVLVNGTTALNCGGATACSGAQLAQFVDAAAYGAQTGTFTGEGNANAPALTNTTAAFRAGNGCTDSDNNAADFTANPTNPRNIAAPFNSCSTSSTPALSVNDLSVVEGNSGTINAVFTISLTTPAGANGVTFTAATADGTATVADNDYQPLAPTNFTIAAGSSSTTITILVNGDTTPEPNETFFLNITNVVGATVAKAQGTCTILNDDLTITAIDLIQGAGRVSPLAGQTVSTRGIVTALRTNGFFIQTPDAEVDNDPNTSEGIFVFTSSAPPAAAARGNSVTVTATVAEFVPPSDPFSPPLTELVTPTAVLLNSTGNPLPVPVVIAATDDNPSGGLDVLEKFEGMRVRVNDLRVVAPTGGSVNETQATATSNGVFFGVVRGVNRPFREPGIELGDPIPAPAPANVPRFDLNPERIRVNSRGQAGATANIDVTTDATVANLVGVMDYAFRTYTILPDPDAPPTVSGNLSAIPVPAPTAGQLTIASFNLERFFDDQNDPAIGEPVLTATAYANRLNKASLAIRNVLRTPDVVAVIEMENLSTLQTLATKINDDAVLSNQPNPNYQPYLIEGNDVGGIDVGFLVKSARVAVIGATQFGKTETYTNPNTGAQDLLNDRPPLVLTATVQTTNGSSFPFTVIVNHLRSLLGVDDATPDGSGTVGARVRAKRRAQAEFLANLVQTRQANDPSEKIFVVGDFNAFQVNDGYVDVLGTIKGAPTPADQVVLASPDLVNPNLINLDETLPNPSLVATNQAYSYVFDGNAQAIDHILITSNLQQRLAGFYFARLDADFPEIYRNDPNRPERISDHDAAVAYVTLDVPTSNITGRITNAQGRGLYNVILTLTDAQTGEVRYGRTGVTGEYRFLNVQSGRDYVITPITIKNSYQPGSQTVTVNGNLTDVNFIATRQ